MCLLSVDTILLERREFAEIDGGFHFALADNIRLFFNRKSVNF